MLNPLKKLKTKKRLEISTYCFIDAFSRNLRKLKTQKNPKKTKRKHQLPSLRRLLLKRLKLLLLHVVVAVEEHLVDAVVEELQLLLLLESPRHLELLERPELLLYRLVFFTFVSH